jgi:GxxExxY protein
LTEKVIGCGIEVHRHLGPGLLESAYEIAMYHELTLAEVHFVRQKEISLNYKGEKLDAGFRADLVIEDALLVELKSIERLMPIHTAQVVTYQRLSGLRTGLLMNFNQRVMRDGVRRISV